MRNDRNVLIVDPDRIHSVRLGKALVRHEFEVYVAHDGATGLEIARCRPVDHAVIELQLPDHAGFQLLEKLRTVRESLKIVVLAAHPSIATAVAAIKLGATQYLPKPVSAHDVIAAFDSSGGNGKPVPAQPQLSLKAIMWEHIERSLLKSGGNVSVAARELGMHRRTLQRRLRHRPD